MTAEVVAWLVLGGCSFAFLIGLLAACRDEPLLLEVLMKLSLFLGILLLVAWTVNVVN